MRNPAPTIDARNVRPYGLPRLPNTPATRPRRIPKSTVSPASGPTTLPYRPLIAISKGFWASNCQPLRAGASTSWRNRPEPNQKMAPMMWRYRRRPCSQTKLGRHETLDQVSLLKKLISGDLDPLLGAVVVLESGDPLPRGAVRLDREPKLQTVGHAVLAVAHHRQRVPVTPRRGAADAVHRVDHRVGRGRGGRTAQRVAH